MLARDRGPMFVVFLWEAVVASELTGGFLEQVIHGLGPPKTDCKSDVTCALSGSGRQNGSPSSGEYNLV